MSTTLPRERTLLPLGESELGAAMALLSSLQDRPGERLPHLEVEDVVELRASLARDERESGRRWWGLVDPEHGGLEALAGYDPSSCRPGALEVTLDGPVVWSDLRRRGLGSTLLSHVRSELERRLPDATLVATVGEDNAPAIAFLERSGFVLRSVARTYVHTGSTVGGTVGLDAALALVTPADRDELEACEDLLVALRERGLPPPRFDLRKIGQDRHTILRAALHGEEAVGLVIATFDLRAAVAWIDAVLCRPGWRKRGVERSLLAQVLADCRSEPRIQRIRAEVTTPPGIDPREEDALLAAGFEPESVDLEFAL